MLLLKASDWTTASTCVSGRGCWQLPTGCAAWASPGAVRELEARRGASGAVGAGDAGDERAQPVGRLVAVGTITLSKRSVDFFKGKAAQNAHDQAVAGCVC